MIWPLLIVALGTQPTQRADSIVRRGIAAMGGEDRWRGVKTLELIGRGAGYHIGDSEWYDGPYFVDYKTVDDWRDVASTRRAVKSRNFNVPADTTSFESTVVSTDTLDMLLQLEHVLWTALKAPDLKRERDTVFRFVTHHVVSFHVGRSPVRLFFESETGVLRMSEVVRAYPYSVFWNAWGDVTERVRYADWSRESTGIWYPHQIDTERNGRQEETVSYGLVRVNATPDSQVFDPPPHKTCGFGCLPADSVPLGVGGAGGVGPDSPGRGPREIAPGIVQIVGAWNSTLVRQRDGIVIIEAPISAGYSRQVIAEAARRFPAAPIKAVISTTDFWWHVAGLREYIARGIPIYVLDRNVRVVTSRAAAPHTLWPDSLSRAPRPPIVRPVSRRMVLGSGENAIELIPFHEEQLDRMLMVYLPGQHLVYTAEGVQLYPTGLVFPQTAMEVVDAVKREGLMPERFIGMHVAATPWTRLLTALDSLAHQ
jgi:hypothetical protein